ncbi:MAG: DNA polymerase III subunit delta, partial [Betaproteobacteria bacterium]
MPIHFFYGTDEYAITGRVNEFLRSMSDPTTAAMNTSRLDVRTVTENDLNTAVNAMPFLAPQRLIIFDNPAAHYSQAAQQKKFLEFLKQVPETANLVLTEIGQLKESHWLVKWARNAGQGVEALVFNVPKLRDMPDWISKEVQAQGGKIDRQAAARLAELTGDDTRQASQEITKLLTYVDFKHAIELSDVEAVSVVTAQGSVFDMVDALGTGNGKKALAALDKLLESEEPFQLFGMVVRQFRLLLQAREIMDDRGNAQTVARELGIAPFVAEKIHAQARGFKIDALESIYRRLLRLDEDVKTGVVPLETALEMFVVEL